VIVDVGLPGMLVLEILVRHVGVLYRSVIVFVLVRSAQMIEPARYPVVIVRDVEVRMRVGQTFVVVLRPFRCHGLDGHLSYLLKAIGIPRSTPGGAPSIRRRMRVRRFEFTVSG
jgi:hypothetical protein